jgi:hypothetical protein
MAFSRFHAGQANVEKLIFITAPLKISLNQGGGVGLRAPENVKSSDETSPWR